MAAILATIVAGTVAFAQQRAPTHSRMSARESPSRYVEVVSPQNSVHDLSVRLVLSSTRVVAGGTLKAQLLIENASGQPIIIDTGCNTEDVVGGITALTNTDISSATDAFIMDGCAHHETTLAVGHSVMRFEIGTNYSHCKMPGTGPGGPACLPGPPIMPPLPAGSYRTAIYYAGVPGLPKPAPLRVTILPK